MRHVEARADVGVDPATLWEAIGSFQGVGDWHPLLATVTGRGERPGSIRRARGLDGSEQVERLQELDPVHYRYSYVLESSPMPVRHYRAELHVEPKQDGTSTVCWSSDFETTNGDPDKTVGMVLEFLDAGVRSLAERYPEQSRLAPVASRGRRYRRR
jgi:hypothetical protein